MHQYSIAFYGWIILFVWTCHIFVCIHQLKDIWSFATFGALIGAARSISVQAILRSYVFNALGHIPTRGITGIYGNSKFTILSQTFFHSGCVILKLHQQYIGFQFLYLFANTCKLSVFYFSLPSG